MKLLIMNTVLVSHHDHDIEPTCCSPKVNENKPTPLVVHVNEIEHPLLGGHEMKIKKRKNKDNILSESQNKKRKSEEDVLFVNKIIKTENTTVECKLEDDCKQTVTSEIDKELLDNKNENYLSPDIERETYSQDEFKITIEKNENADENSQRTTPDGLFHNGFNYNDDDEHSCINHQDHDNSHAESNKKHYDTQHTPTKTHSERDFEKHPKLKKRREDYSDLNKNLSRQRTKMNRLLANEHERRRVAQLNSAYQNLRQLIPGYQCNTKLPKIKILRYAINYIAHLDNILEADGV